jgi:hypothetical protein
MAKSSIIERIDSGERARLIPVTTARQKELAAVSALLAVFRIVPDYAKAMLEEVGAPVTKRARLTAMTEVCFKKPKQSRQTLPRPDGLLVVDTSRREWTALVEAKIKNEELKADQLEKYLELAREVGADALITISNQFATVPSHHPVKVDGKKTRSVDLYHFSWLSLLSNAQLLAESDSVKDREQAIVLQELIRFLDHDQSGVQPFDRMGSMWKDICAKVQNAETLRKNDPIVEAAIADWHQLCRYLALTLSTHIGKRVAIVMGRKHKNNPKARVEDHVNTLMTRYRLADDFTIPNTAGDIHLEADLRRRTISLSMRLDPPGDKKRPTAAVNWLTRQLRDDKPENLLVTCHWPRRIEATTLNFQEATEHPDDLIPEGVSEMPTALEIKRIVDLAGKFRGAKTMVELTQAAFVAFYREVGQNLTPWVAPPPKYKKREVDDDHSVQELEVQLPRSDHGDSGDD